MDEIYFRQIKAGPMQNFVYAIGCPRTRECVLIDPAWEVASLLEQLGTDGMTLTGVLITHYHPDHCGGSSLGFTVEGLPELMAQQPVPVHINEHEAPGLKEVTGIDDSDMVKHASGDQLKIGDVEVTFLHTPGHTPGSQCFRVGDSLVSGDTLFLEGCGRVDLPGGDVDELYYSLTQRLAKLPDDVTLYPGHHYHAKPSADLGEVRRTNYALQVPTVEAWRQMMGR